MRVDARLPSFCSPTLSVSPSKSSPCSVAFLNRSKLGFIALRDTAKMVPQVSVAPYLALLEEPEHELQAVALTQLNELVDVFWSEIADASTTMYSTSAVGGLMVIVRFCMRIKSFHSGSWRR